MWVQRKIHLQMHASFHQFQYRTFHFIDERTISPSDWRGQHGEYLQAIQRLKDFRRSLHRDWIIPISSPIKCHGGTESRSIGLTCKLSYGCCKLLMLRSVTYRWIALITWAIILDELLLCDSALIAEIDDLYAITNTPDRLMVWIIHQCLTFVRSQCQRVYHRQQTPTLAIGTPLLAEKT